MYPQTGYPQIMEPCLHLKAINTYFCRQITRNTKSLSMKLSKRLVARTDTTCLACMKYSSSWQHFAVAVFVSAAL